MRQEASRNLEGMVDSLFLPNGRWNTRKLEDLFDDNSVTDIINIFWVDCMCPDKVIWFGERSGDITVKSAYKYTISFAPEPQECWKFMWKSCLHERSKLFLEMPSCKSSTVRFSLEYPEGFHAIGRRLGLPQLH